MSDDYYIKQDSGEATILPCLEASLVHVAPEIAVIIFALNVIGCGGLGTIVSAKLDENGFNFWALGTGIM